MSIEKYFKKKKKRKRAKADQDPNPAPKKKMKRTAVDSFSEIERTVDPSSDWMPFLKKQFKKGYFKDLKKFLVKEEEANKKIYPPVNEVFNAFNYCKLADVKVVILGQDPYHGPGQAHGLCFSVKKGVKIPPSLRNVYKELKSDIKGFEPPNHGYLEGWAKQGVFMLNNLLTVIDSTPKAHKKQGWEEFTASVIDHINRNARNVVFMLWGGPAKKKCKNIDKKRHCVLTSAHPSPLSASRGFYGSKCFSKANHYLTLHGKHPIKWKKL